MGRTTCTRAKLSFVPPWILDEALHGELKGWDPYISVEPLQKGSIKSAVIGSYVLYSVKTRESGEHMVKARLVIHGSRYLVTRKKESITFEATHLHYTFLLFGSF